MPSVSTKSLTEATTAMAEWRKRATAGVAAVSSMNAAVERMSAAAMSAQDWLTAEPAISRAEKARDQRREQPIQGDDQ